MKNIKIVITLIALGLQVQATKIGRQIKNSVCANKDGVMVAMPGSCAGFFFCIHGDAIASSCGNFYHFNSRLSICDHPERALCEIAVEKQKDEAITDEEAEGICRGTRTESHMFGKSKSCTQFYVCNNKRALKRVCPPQKHFNSKAKVCQDIHLSQCNDGKILELPIPKTTVNPIATKPFTMHSLKKRQIPASLCTRAKQDAILPHPWDCGLFVYCVHGTHMVMNCPQGLYFSTKTQRCDWPAIAKCVVNN